MGGATFRKRRKVYSYTPLALANNRQLNNSTVVIPTDHNMDSLLFVELIRNVKRTAVFRTDQGVNLPPRQEGGYTTKGRRPWPTADPGDKHPHKI